MYSFFFQNQISFFMNGNDVVFQQIAELNEEMDEMTKPWMCPKDLKKQCEKLQEDFQEQAVRRWFFIWVYVCLF